MNARVESSDVAVLFTGPEKSREAKWSSYGFDNLVAICRWMHSRSRALLAQRTSRRLTVTETLSLGEKRFVSILCVDGEQFLLGGSSANVVLLAKLERSATGNSGLSVCESFSDLLSRKSADGMRNVHPGCGEHGL